MSVEPDSQAMKKSGSKKASNACLLCKKRKRKCSTEVPCDGCTASRQECIYSVATDGRRKESMKRVRIDFEHNQKLFHSLWGKLREGRFHEIRPFLEDGASLDEFAAYLNEGSLSSSAALSSPVEDTKNRVKDEYESEEHLDGLLKSFKSLSSMQRNSLPARGCMEKASTANLASSAVTSATLCDPPFKSTSILTPPLCITEPKNFQAADPSITTLFTRFRDAGRHAISLGASPEVVLGPETINLEPALRGRIDRDLLTPATWICELQQSFESLDVYVRLSWIYFINQYLRWSIFPTNENYNLLPDCMKSTSLQCQKQHHAAIDLCHLPALRDILIESDHVDNDKEREDIVVFQIAGLRTNWTGSWDEAVTHHKQLGYRTLTTDFIRTISRVDHWIAGSQALRKFPGLSHQMLFVRENTLFVDDRGLHQMALQDQNSQARKRTWSNEQPG